MRRFATLVSLLVSLTFSVAARAESADGKLAFNTHCRNCHSLKKGDNRLGPSLYGILGAPAGQVDGYRAYSGSLKGFTWDEAILDKFIASPTSVAPTTNMNYPPVADSAARRKIIEFIRSKTTW
jgi:cytochrome c